jgi:16S rRNA (adenine1518-N6/adenine1519-N6)-dimethyltransferase
MKPSTLPSVRPKQSLGQNFLIDANISRKITRELKLGRDDIIVEIGPGTGALTTHLAERAAHLILVELDQRIVENLRRTYPSSVATVFHLDFLDFDLEAFRRKAGRRLRVVGNIPYHLTSAILLKIFEAAASVQDVTIMIQREVARRIVASPGTKQYGILSVFSHYYGSPKILFDVSPNCFFPRPKVMSSLIHVDLPETLPVRVNEELFRTIVRTVFGKRRKTLRNGLHYLPFDEQTVTRIEKELEFPVELRPEELSVKQFVDLTNRIEPLL